MTRILAAVALTLILVSTADAHRRYYSYSYANLDAACTRAAHEGGPCGCWAEEHFFGRSDHVLNGWNPWLADEWRRVFPHVRCAPGTAAVYPGRHVVPVSACSPDGTTFTAEDSWGSHEASARGVVFVQPSLYAGAQ